MTLLLSSQHDTVVANMHVPALDIQVIANKIQHNNRSLLFRLPVEIIGLVILQLSHVCALTGRWKNVLLVCSRIREIAITTIHLWTHIDLYWPSHLISLYLSRSKTLPLTLEVLPTNHYRRNSSAKIDLTLASKCMLRSRTASVSFLEGDDGTHDQIMEVAKQLAPSLAFLHVALAYDCSHPFTSYLKNYTNLVDLTLEDGYVNQAIDANLPHLSRLQIYYVQTDSHLSLLIGFLRHSPNLTEFIFYEMGTEEEFAFNIPVPRLELRYLRKIVFIGNAWLVHGLLRAISSPTPQLVELVVNVWDPVDEFIPGNVLPDIFKRVTELWKPATSAPISPGHLTWTTDHDGVKTYRLDIDVSGLNTPELAFTTPFDHHQAALYQRLGLIVKFIDIVRLDLDPFAPTPWTEWLDKVVTHDLIRLEFRECHYGADGVANWIRKRLLAGYMVHAVEFVDCRLGPTTHNFYILDGHEDFVWVRVKWQVTKKSLLPTCYLPKYTLWDLLFS
jgi:hypothetical protein